MSVRVLQDQNCHIFYESLEEIWLGAYCQSTVWARGSSPRDTLEEIDMSLQEFLLCPAWGKCRLYLG